MLTGLSFRDVPFQPKKTDDPRANFYRMYAREAKEYDVQYVKKFDDDLNTILVLVRHSLLVICSRKLSHLSLQAGLLSAVSTAFVIDFNSNLRPDPNEKSATLLRAILLTLNQSAIPGETPTVPPVQESPPNTVFLNATSYMHSSLILSLFVAFFAMLAKQWINRYLNNLGRSMIERCGDRQRKFDGLRKQSPQLFSGILMSVLQLSLIFLICGLCLHMRIINSLLATSLIFFSALAAGFYIITVIAGTSSYTSPFQTPLSNALRYFWKDMREIFGSFPPLKCPFRVKLPPRFRRLPAVPLTTIEVQQDVLPQRPRVDCSTQKMNTDDVRCVSWILRDIPSPEALDAAIPFAGTIRWFDGINAKPPYDQIVSTFEACFDSTGKLYPGSEDRAYHSGQAMVWIHTLAMCKSEESAIRFPLNTDYASPGPDDNLRDLLQVISVAGDPNRCVEQLLRISPHHTSLHSRWISDLLLNYSWANRTKLDHEYILGRISETNETETTIPLEATLNRLLVWCTFLGSPVEGEMLRIQDKSCDISYFFSLSCSLPLISGHIGHILDQLSEAVVSATNGTPTRRGFIPPTLRDLVKLKNYPFSSRSRGLIIRFIELIDYEWFERAGVGRFIELLDYLHVAVEDMDDQSKWTKHLLGTVRTPEGVQRLPQACWELLAEVAISFPRPLGDGPAYDPQIMAFLAEAQEWRKLECWVAVVWMVWPPGAGEITEDLEHSVLSLFRQQPGAAQKLRQWMERWSQANREEIPDSFQRICEQA